MTALNGTIQGIGNGENRIVKKTGTTIKLSVYDNLDRVIVFNEAGETSQSGTPTPDNPVPIVGIGTRQLDGTYSVSIDYDDGDERSGRITASGLAYPLYEGDVLDFVNGKVIRKNGYKVFDGSESWYSYISYNGYYLPVSDMKIVERASGNCSSLITTYNSAHTNNSCWFGVNNNRFYAIEINITGVTDLATWKTWLSNNPTYVVYPLETPTDEYITLTGDISDIGTATVTADGTLTVKYDKVEMAIRKYSSPPDWSKINYSATPTEVLDAFYKHCYQYRPAPTSYVRTLSVSPACLY